jgi:thioesterase domain-containing protein
VLEETALRQAEEFFHQQIPITRAMGVRVVAHDKKGFVVEAPIALNSNHLRTAFGGSINAVATLAAYGLLWLELHDPAMHVVVAESSIRYLRPVHETIRAICPRPDRELWKAFRGRLAEKGKAHITLRVNVAEEGQAAAAFEGTFVVRKKQIRNGPVTRPGAREPC